MGMARAPDAAAATVHPGAERDMRNAGRHVKNAARDTGHAMKRTSKKIVHKSAYATERGAAKVRRKTVPR